MSKALVFVAIAAWFGAVACAKESRSAADDTLSARAVAANARETASLPHAAAGGGRAATSARGPDRSRNASAAPLDGYGADVGFRSRARLNEHFEKHGGEFGNISVDEYLQRAQALRDARAGEGGDILEIIRDDGVVSRFDRKTGAFLAFDRDGTIRTFFKPNDGERYFRRQSRRTPRS